MKTCKRVGKGVVDLVTLAIYCNHLIWTSNSIAPSIDPYYFYIHKTVDLSWNTTDD